VQAIPSRTGFVLSRRAFDHHVGALVSTGAALSAHKAAGRPAALTHEEREVLAGWVLHCNFTDVPVSLADCVGKAAEFFGVHVSAMAASKWLAADGFVFKQLHKNAKGFKLDVEQMCAIAWQWVSEQRTLGHFDRPSQLCSIDFTFTGHRTDRHYGFGLSGGGQILSAEATPRNTSCIATCVWADGVNRIMPPFVATASRRRHALRKSLDSIHCCATSRSRPIRQYTLALQRRKSACALATSEVGAWW
jgi:transposase